MKVVLRAFLLLMVVIAVAGAAAAYAIASRGLSTRTEPSAVEETIARAMRAAATPRVVRALPNPVEPTEAVLAEGLEHFADHCAVCHGNDGSGRIEMGRSLYPPAPDMRAARTQALSDGELFSIIENGIRLTGMPAWSTGTPEGERGSWGLVHFIRRLPTLTPDEIAAMESLNPKSPEQFREEEQVRRFLAGEDGRATPASQASHERHR